MCFGGVEHGSTLAPGLLNGCFLPLGALMCTVSVFLAVKKPIEPTMIVTQKQQQGEVLVVLGVRKTAACRPMDVCNPGGASMCRVSLSLAL